MVPRWVKTNRFQAARGLPKLQLKPGSFVGTAAKADTKGNLTAQESRSLPGIGARHQRGSLRKRDQKFCTPVAIAAGRAEGHPSS
jgi:hypothetical protein